MRYYHGSNDELAIDVVLLPRGDEYEAEWSGTDFYSVLEMHRPEGMLSHKNAVFMVGDPDDIDLAGGGTEWIFEVEPQGEPTRHDLNWSSEISCLMGDGHAVDSPEVVAAAANYWSGVPHIDEQVWEYLAASARILDCQPFEDFVPVERSIPGI